jgi:pterin-4a-carbinolamine dehydratase
VESAGGHAPSHAGGLDLVEALAFMTATALRARAMDPSSERGKVWNRVLVDPVTPGAAGNTAPDLELAAIVERLAARPTPPCTRSSTRR